MSTKTSIKWRDREGGRPGFHLYDDAIEALTVPEGEEPAVYLCLEGVAVELQTLEQGGASVTIALPRELARNLGLLATP